MIKMAKGDIAKLNELIGHLDNLPQASFDKMLEYLSSKEITNKPENQRIKLWEKLISLASKHRHHTDAKWTFS